MKPFNWEQLQAGIDAALVDSDDGAE
jgi:hypothetical protein